MSAMRVLAGSEKARDGNNVAEFLCLTSQDHRGKVEVIQRESEMATPLLTQSRLYTPEEVAELLQVEVREVFAFIREKRLLASQLGEQYRIPADAVEDLVIANADPDAYERFLSSRIQRAQEQNLSWDPAEVERDVVNALLAVRYGRPA